MWWVVSALSPGVCLFSTSRCIENLIMCAPSPHSSLPGSDGFCQWKQSVFIFLSSSPSFWAFLVSLCAYFPSGISTMWLLSSSRFGVSYHPNTRHFDAMGGWCQSSPWGQLLIRCHWEVVVVRIWQQPKQFWWMQLVLVASDADSSFTPFLNWDWTQVALRRKETIFFPNHLFIAVFPRVFRSELFWKLFQGSIDVRCSHSIGLYLCRPLVTSSFPGLSFLSSDWECYNIFSLACFLCAMRCMGGWRMAACPVHRKRGNHQQPSSRLCCPEAYAPAPATSPKQVQGPQWRNSSRMPSIIAALVTSSSTIV